MTKPTVFLDIDDTILDAVAVKRDADKIIDANYGPGSNRQFADIYKEVKEEKGFFDLQEIALRFAKQKNSPDYASAIAAFTEVDFSKYLRPQADRLLDFLSKNSNLVVFSQGHEIFQRRKAEKLGLFELASKVIITQSKKQDIGNLFVDFSPPYIMIDDNPEVLREAKRLQQDLTTIRVKYGKHIQEEVFKADYEAENLKEVVVYLRNLLKV